MTSPTATSAAPLEHGIYREPAFIDAATCARLRQPTAAVVQERLGIGRADQAVTYESARVCNVASIDSVADEVHRIFGDVYRRVVPAQFGMTVEWYERPQLLCYPTGGLFRHHCDGEVYDRQAQSWRRVIDRDISVILYLNSEFTGGALDFPLQQVQLTPTAGLLVAFPSGHTHPHAALPITAGERFALVSWAAAVGTPRLHKTPKSAVMLR